MWESGWESGYGEWLLIFFLKKTLFETESLRLGFHVVHHITASEDFHVDARPPARSDLNKTCKPSLKDLIYGSKIESLKLEMLLRSILSKPDLLTKWLWNYA